MVVEKPFKKEGGSHPAPAIIKHILRYKGEVLLIAPQEMTFHYPRMALKPLKTWRFPSQTSPAFMPELMRGRALWREFSPHVLHLINPGMLGLSLIRQARADGIPVLVSYHEQNCKPWSREAPVEPLVKQGLPWAYAQWMLKLANRILVHDEAALAAFVQSGLRQTEVWKPGVDTHFFSPTHRQWFWRERLSGGAPHTPLILYVGPLVPSARLTWLRYVCDVRPDVRIAIVGEGPQQEFLRDYFAGKPVVFTGPLEGFDLARAYASADFLLIPGDVRLSEQVLLAAMASQLPVIAPRTPVTERHLHHGHNGLLFNPKDFLTMLDNVSACLKPEVARTMGLAARQYAETQDRENRLHALLNHYTTLINTNTLQNGWRMSQDALVPKSGV